MNRLMLFELVEHLKRCSCCRPLINPEAEVEVARKNGG